MRALAIWLLCGAPAIQGCPAVKPAGTGVADAAGSVPDGGLDAGDAASGACADDGDECTEASCCDGLECLALNGGPLTCHAACRDALDCGSGCCVSLSGAMPRRLCGAAEICFPDGCEPEGQSCDADTPCCAGLACVRGAEPDERNGCRPRCRHNDDCESGCCTLFNGSAQGFCDDAQYCACLEQGQDCSAPGRSCCDGSRCARFGDDAFRCLPTCASDEGCGGNCCTQLEGGDDVCAPFPC